MLIIYMTEQHFYQNAILNFARKKHSSGIKRTNMRVHSKTSQKID